MGEAAVMGDGGVDLGHEGLGFCDGDYDFHHGSIPFLNFSSKDSILTPLMHVVQ